MDDEDKYIDDNTNVNLDEDYFDPYEQADQRDLIGIMALANDED